MHRSELILGKCKEDLSSKKVVIVGVGGTGSSVALLLSRMGISLELFDRDIIEESNLERQTLFDIGDIGKPKAEVAAEQLTKNGTSEKNIVGTACDINPETISFDCDLVIDCTDNPETRLILNDYCKKNNIPWIYTGAVSQIGSVQFFHPDGPCYRCFYDGKYGETCSEVGVLPSLVHLVGSLACDIALKFLVKEEHPHEMFRIDLASYRFFSLGVRSNPDCLACKGEYTYLEGKDVKKLVRFCARGRYHFFFQKPIDLDDFEDKLGATGKGNVRRDSYSVANDDFVIYSHGRVIIEAENEILAKKKYDELIGIL